LNGIKRDPPFRAYGLSGHPLGIHGGAASVHADRVINGDDIKSNNSAENGDRRWMLMNEDLS